MANKRGKDKNPRRKRKFDRIDFIKKRWQEINEKDLKCGMKVIYDGETLTIENIDPEGEITFMDCKRHCKSPRQLEISDTQSVDEGGEPNESSIDRTPKPGRDAASQNSRRRVNKFDIQMGGAKSRQRAAA